MTVVTDLESEEVVYCTDDHVDCGGVASLRPQVVLELWKTWTQTIHSVVYRCMAN